MLDLAPGRINADYSLDWDAREDVKRIEARPMIESYAAFRPFLLPELDFMAGR